MICSWQAYASFTNHFVAPFNFEPAYKTLQLKPKEISAQASQLVIKALEEPLKCEEEIPVTVQYTIAGETVESGSVTIVYLVGEEIKLNTAHLFHSAILFTWHFLFIRFYLERR